MKLLLDQNISFRFESKIQDIFPGSKHISSCGLINASDYKIWSFAKENNFAVVTFDSDFFELNTLYGSPPKVIWIRTGNLTSENLRRILIDKRVLIMEYLSSAENTSCLELNSN